MNEALSFFIHEKTFKADFLMKETATMPLS